MNYYYDVCEKTNKIKSKSRNLQNITRNELEKYIRLNYTFEKPVFLYIDESF